MTAFTGDIENIVGYSIRGGVRRSRCWPRCLPVGASVLTRLDALIVDVAARSG
jgi:hypothetical protein